MTKSTWPYPNIRTEHLVDRVSVHRFPQLLSDYLRGTSKTIRHLLTPVSCASTAKYRLANEIGKVQRVANVRHPTE